VASIKNTRGQAVGRVTLTESPAGMLVRYDFRELPEGEHAFHIHEKGLCEPRATGDTGGQKGSFSGAGGHLNPHDKAHGILADNGFHAGDLPNIVVLADGRAAGSFFTDRVRVTGDDGSENDRAVLLDDDGAALVIHEGADDYRSDPAGDAGTRIACGEISATK
jgi:Cu-Zn family superoxide dismutase